MTETPINGLSRPPPSPSPHQSQLIIRLINRTAENSSSLKDAVVSYISSSVGHQHQKQQNHPNHISTSFSSSSYHPPIIRHLLHPAFSSSSPPSPPLPPPTEALPHTSVNISVPYHHHHITSSSSSSYHHQLSNLTISLTNDTEVLSSSSSDGESISASPINATAEGGDGSGSSGFGGLSGWFSWWNSSIYTHPDVLLAFALIVFYAIFVLFICAIILRIVVTIVCSSSGRTMAATFATSSDGFSGDESSSQRTRGYSQSYSTSYTNNNNGNKMNNRGPRFFAHEMTSFAIGDRTNSPSIIDEEDEES
ncbi:hypothetical protein TYRP_004225 [Tyrophagus putrescentiae]|nr:hypothetical protein TYRP_004225 [Tyrophagus putrescentiae]